MVIQKWFGTPKSNISNIASTASETKVDHGDNSNVNNEDFSNYHQLTAADSPQPLAWNFYK